MPQLPKLLAFLPCEKAIIDREGNVSLITLLNSLRVEVPVAELPENAALPMRWHVLTMWWRDQPGEWTRFEQHFELVGPDGRVLITDTAPFELSGVGSVHRHVSQVFGLPLPRGNECLLKLYVREHRDGADRQLVMTYPLTIQVGLQPPKEHE